MIWALLAGTLGAASKEANAAEEAITLFGAVILVYAWSMYFYIKRQQARRAAKAAEEGVLR